jgi:aspartate/methionine/tyrosine aminotransferase
LCLNGKIAFGSPNNIRISYAASNENIKNAISRIKKAVTID